MPRQLILHAGSLPLGDAFLQSLTAREGLSELFELDFEVKSDRQSLVLADLIGKGISAEIATQSGTPRYWHGLIARVEQTADDGGRKWSYRFHAVPWLWFLTRRADSRVFAEMTATDIIKKVFKDAGFDAIDVSGLNGECKLREYTVQYRETDFNFVSRLLEDEGIYYYFKHEKTAHKLVLTNGIGGHHPYAGYPKIPYRGLKSGSAVMEEYVWDWGSSLEVASGKYGLIDFDYASPSAALTATKSGGGRFADLAMHDYPGTPAWHGDKLDDGDLTARVGARLQELQVAAVRARGHGNSRGIATGCLFKLDAPDGRGGKHPRADQNDEHLVVSAEHEITDSSDTSGSGGSFGYEVDFQAIPSSVQYRPPRVTRKPFIQGPQTATVTGPDGDDKIHTDKQGRIQVQFHWARPAGDDGATGKPSCYLRVAQIWAGPKYGAFMLPRIGHEVVVSFLEGDPDRPLVTGSVYNGDNQAPFPLPGEKTKSGLRTRSSTGGGDADCNEFVFEDKKGDEFVLLHAQKDLTVEVENNETRTVDKNRKTEIKEEDEEKVGANQKLEVVKNQTLKVSGDQSVAVEGKQEVKVTKDQTTDVTQNQTVTITQKYKLKANQEIAFECGASKITMKPDGTIKIEGVQIKIAGMASVDVHADAQVNVTGLMVGIKGDVQTEVKGLMINLSGDAMAMLKGAITMIG